MLISRAGMNVGYRFVVWLTVLATAAVLSACQSTSTGTTAASPDTWATVDGRPITRADVDKAYRRNQQPDRKLSEEETLTAELSLLDELITQDLLLEKAKTLKVVLPETDLDAAYAEARKNIPEDAFQQELTRRNLTAADMREGLRRELMAQKVIEQEVVAKATVTDQEVADFFNANRAQFNLPEDAYRLGQIVITPGPDPQGRLRDDATTPQAAADKVRMLMERLKAGSAFGDLAREHSEDPESGPRGGDLGLVPVSALNRAPAPLREAVVKMMPGSVRVVTVNGVHTIVLFLGQEKAGQRDLSMPVVRENITTTLRGRKQQLLRVAYLTALRADADVVNYLARRVVEGKGKLPAEPPAAATSAPK